MRPASSKSSTQHSLHALPEIRALALSQQLSRCPRRTVIAKGVHGAMAPAGAVGEAERQAEAS